MSDPSPLPERCAWLCRSRLDCDGGFRVSAHTQVEARNAAYRFFFLDVDRRGELFPRDGDIWHRCSPTTRDASMDAWAMSVPRGTVASALPDIVAVADGPLEGTLHDLNRPGSRNLDWGRVISTIGLTIKGRTKLSDGTPGFHIYHVHPRSAQPHLAHYMGTCAEESKVTLGE